MKSQEWGGGEKAGEVMYRLSDGWFENETKRRVLRSRLWVF